jgi:biotin-dependent carboxylase-like uncharacterized protein
MIEILDPGALATVQDLGRIGLAHLGVPRSGAFDRSALRLANRLVGNPDGAAGIEATLGLAFRVDVAATIALTGAACAGAPDWNAAVTLEPGTTVRLRAPQTGLRSYLAVRGGLDVPPVLGSRSTDLLSGLGPAPLHRGDALSVGLAPAGAVTGATAGSPPTLSALSIYFGPRHEWFTPAARHALLEARWTVRPESNRIGVRLDGPALERAVARELPSEPALPGALQVPPDGRPILFGPDAPVTGGYPVIAVIDAVGLDAAAQLRPGDVVRFRPRSGAGS